jgi:hypothetical protein
MIRNSRHPYQVINIRHSLNGQGLEALNATPELKWQTKELLGMFLFHFIEIETQTFNIKTICKATVTVEPARSNKLIPQCKICQSFCLIRNYFNKVPKCVNCSGPHLTSESDKPQLVQLKCCHCGKNCLANNLEITRIIQNNK